MAGQQHPFESVIEEWEQAVANWMPHNADDKASFQAVRFMLTSMTQVLESVASGCTTLAGKSQDNVLFKDGAGDLLAETAQYVGAAATALGEVSHGVDQIHRDDVDRIEDDDARQESLDWGVNRNF